MAAIIMVLIIGLFRFICIIRIIILMAIINGSMIIRYIYSKKIDRSKDIYGAYDEKVLNIINYYKNSNKFFQRNLEMNMDEEIMFIYNIQEFLKSNKQQAKFKFLNDEIALAKEIRRGVDGVHNELLVNLKHNYMQLKHYTLSNYSDGTIHNKYELLDYIK